jgi:hypothetical protein
LRGRVAVLADLVLVFLTLGVLILVVLALTSGDGCVIGAGAIGAGAVPKGGAT